MIEEINNEPRDLKEEFNKILNNLKIKGEKYNDLDFPADESSLIGNWNDNTKRIRDIVEEWKQFKWIRSGDIPCLNNPKLGELAIFKDSIEPQDVKMGRLKDAYYISVLAAIAEHPNRIRNMFMSDTIHREGIFGVKVYKNGEETLVTIDNMFPCKNRKPCFSRATSNELWPLILEKVWAKLHGNYEAIIEG